MEYESDGGITAFNLSRQKLHAHKRQRLYARTHQAKTRCTRKGKRSQHRQTASSLHTPRAIKSPRTDGDDQRVARLEDLRRPAVLHKADLHRKHYRVSHRDGGRGGKKKHAEKSGKKDRHIGTKAEKNRRKAERYIKKKQHTHLQEAHGALVGQQSAHEDGERRVKVVDKLARDVAQLQAHVEAGAVPAPRAIRPIRSW